MMALVALKLALVRANPYLHGSARWASGEDIRGSGLLGVRRGLRELWTRSGTNGVYVGYWVDRYGRQHYLRHSGPEHVCATRRRAPVRVSGSSFRRSCRGRAGLRHRSQRRALELDGWLA